MSEKPTYQDLQNRIQELEQKEHEKALREGVKELNCMYGISHLVESEDDLSEILQKTVNLIPDSWQYPEIAVCRLGLSKKEYRTRQHCGNDCNKCSHASLSQPIVVKGRRSGEIKICYTEEKPQADEGPFLKEERDLINAVAERLGRIVERKQAEESLEIWNSTIGCCSIK